MPPKTVRLLESQSLEDIPVFYFTEKAQWPEFKRALASCGLTWGLPDWMTTIVYRGAEYVELIAKHEEIKVHFPAPVAQVDEKKFDVNDVSSALLKTLGISTLLGDDLKPSQRYCNLTTLKWEEDKKLPARQHMWTWFNTALRGTGAQVGPYLTKQVPVYDIAGLFRRLAALVDILTICTLDEVISGVTNLEFDPTKQELFEYILDLKRALERLKETSAWLREADRV